MQYIATITVIKVAVVGGWEKGTWLAGNGLPSTHGLSSVGSQSVGATQPAERASWLSYDIK